MGESGECVSNELYQDYVESNNGGESEEVEQENSEGSEEDNY